MIKKFFIAIIIILSMTISVFANSYEEDALTSIREIDKQLHLINNAIAGIESNILYWSQYNDEEFINKLYEYYNYLIIYKELYELDRNNIEKKFVQHIKNKNNEQRSNYICGNGYIIVNNDLFVFSN